MRRLQTRVGADLGRYTENFFLGMSPRQTVLGVAGVAAVTAGYMLGLPGILSVCMGFPLLVAGFYRPDGLSVEKFIGYWIESVLVRPAVRVYEEQSELFEFLFKGRLLGRRVEAGRRHGRRGRRKEEK